MGAAALPGGLFGSCGVRGVVGDLITDDVVLRLAASFAHYIGSGRRVCVGRDTRRSGPSLEALLVGELVRHGLQVTKLGVVATPTLYYLTRELGFDAGVMITASHNPPEYNGFKFCNAEGMSVDQAPIERGFFSPPDVGCVNPGMVDSLSGAELFFDKLSSICSPPLSRKKLVVDCACGPNSLYLPGFLRNEGHDVITCNCEPDVEKCDRVVEPMESTLTKTVNLLKQVQADGGVCFDGDNDRVVFLDNKGFLGFQRANAIIAMIVLEQTGGGEVIGSVETGRYVEEAVKRAGSTLRRTIVGDIHIAREVKERGAVLGLEECGHYIVPSIGHFSSTVYPATLLLGNRDINQIRDELSFIPPIYSAERRVDCGDDRKQVVGEGVTRRILSLDGRATTIDGVRMEWDDGWLLVRPSGTSPYMKINAEAFSRDRLDELLATGLGIVQEALR